MDVEAASILTIQYRRVGVHPGSAYRAEWEEPGAMIGNQREPPPRGFGIDGQSTDPRQWWTKRPRGRLYQQVVPRGTVDGWPKWRLYEYRGDAWHLEAEGTGQRDAEPGTAIGLDPPSGVIVSRMAPGMRQVELSLQAAKGRRPMGVADYEEK